MLNKDIINPKDSRKWHRKLVKQIKHKLLFKIPLNEEEQHYFSLIKC